MKIMIILFLLQGITPKENNTNCTDITLTCKNDKKNVQRNSIIDFEVLNNCTKSKYVIFSIECLDTNKVWQEFDSDIFTENTMGLKPQKILHKKRKKFKYEVDKIDQEMIVRLKTSTFRITLKVYSKDQSAIVETKNVCTFSISSR